MLTLPTSDCDHILILGIDPGTTHLGIGCIEVNLNDMSIKRSYAQTLRADKLADNQSWLNVLHGDRFNRITALHDTLVQIFNELRPHVIIAESPFFNSKFPAALQALVEVLSAIRHAVIVYDVWKSLGLVPPSLVKKAIGVSGHGDKHQMKEKLSQLPNLNYNGSVPLLSLDEHSIDALAIAYYAYYNGINSN